MTSVGKGAQADAKKKPSRPKAPPRRETKAERELRTATMKDLDHESRHRRTSTAIGAVAILTTGIFSIGSCAAAVSAIQSNERIAAAQSAQDRDERRLRCGDQAVTAFARLVMLQTMINDAGTRADPPTVIGAFEEATHAAVLCSAARMTEDSAEQRMDDALKSLASASVGSGDEQRAAALAVGQAFNEYIKIDVTAMDEYFELQIDSNSG